MAGSDEEKRAWVSLVLGVEIPADDGAEDPFDLKNRITDATRQLAQLKQAGDPALAELLTLHKDALTAYQTKAEDAPAKMDALESALALALSAARGRTAAESSKGAVEHAKLLLRWRQARSRVETNLSSLGAKMLNDPEVMDDPLYDDVEEAVSLLPEILPDFSGLLEDLLEEADEPDADIPKISREALETLKDYRADLADSAALQELEEFSSEYGLGQISLMSEFNAALDELEQELRKAA